MDDLLLHACCGPCSTVAVPAWRERGVEPLAWFHNPNIQPAAELERRLESMRRYGRAAGLELVVEPAVRLGDGVAAEWARGAGRGDAGGALRRLPGPAPARSRRGRRAPGRAALQHDADREPATSGTT